MAYTKTLWQDRIVEKPRTFIVTNNPDGTITLIPSEGAIVQAGTPITASNLNNIEKGLEEIHRVLGELKIEKSNKDSNGIYTQVDYKREDNTLFMRSVLSGGTSPQYTTRTITIYDTDGTTVLQTITHTLTYDSDGNIVSEL